MSFDFPKALAELVYGKWTDVPRAQGYQAGRQPPKALLLELMNTCFFASMMREEQRITDFDLALCSPSDLPEPPLGFSRYTKLFNLIRFDQPRKLSVRELVRLAPACNAEKTIILVGYDLYDGDRYNLYIWGMVDVGWRPWVVATRLMELRVRVSGPGEMKVTVHGRVRCSYKDGRISYPDPGVAQAGRIYDFFKESMRLLSLEVESGSAAGQGSSPDPWEDYRALAASGYLFVLQELIERMQQLQHGGCVLVVPEATSGVSNTTIKYRCRDDTVWNYLCGRQVLRDQFQREDVESGLRDALDALIRLTAVDGAVVMTRKFELLGFGAVVQLPPTPEYRVFRSHDGQASQGTVIAPHAYGTRHRSAFEFCYRCSPSVAIVASQDGDVKLVTRAGRDIVFWENTVFD